MEQAERIARWRRMMDVLRRYDISWWADAFLKELAGQRRTSKARSPAPG
jgi:trehalose-6-phosphate synthase